MGLRPIHPRDALDGRVDRGWIVDGAWNPLGREIDSKVETQGEQVSGVTIDTAGTGYAIGDVVDFSSSGTTSSASAFVSDVGENGEITEITITDKGSYSKAPTASITGSSGEGGTLSVDTERLALDTKKSFYSAGLVRQEPVSQPQNRSNFDYCEQADETAEHTLFLGASISQFSSSAGWNSSVSTLNVTLVEDDCCVSPIVDSVTGAPIRVTTGSGAINVDLNTLSLVSSTFRAEEKTDDGNRVTVTDSGGVTVTGYVVDGQLYPTVKVYYNNIQEKMHWVGKDRFNPPPIGNPVHFRYQDFIFNGIIKNWSQERTTSGTTYKVKIEDPREVLKGCQLILDNYDGGVKDCPNLVNPYGLLEHHGGQCIDHELFGRVCFPGMYCPTWEFQGDIDCGVNYSGSTENTGFGGSGINSGGVTFFYLWLAIDYLCNNPLSTNYFPQFGGPPVLREDPDGKPIEFLVDLLALTETELFQDYYRVGGDTRSLDDLINRVCNDAALQYLVTMRFVDYFEVDPEDDGKIWGWPDKNLFPQIQVWTYDIFTQPSAPIKVDVYDQITHPPKGCADEDPDQIRTIDDRLAEGDIAAILGPDPEVESLSRGLELRNEPCNYFLVGDNFNPVIQSPQYRTVPYWGSFDQTIYVDGAPKQTRMTAAPYFSMQGGAGAVYWPTIGDLSIFDGVMLPADSWGIPGLSMWFATVGEIRSAMAGFSQWQTWQYWIGDEARQKSICGFNMPIGYRNAAQVEAWRVGFFHQFPWGPFGLSRAMHSINTGSAVMSAVGGYLADIRANPQYAQMAFEQIQNLGNENYGKKWLIRLPDMCLTGEPETLHVRMNWEVMSTGWQDDICIGLPEPELMFFRDEQNKLESFARFSENQAMPDGFPVGSRRVFNHDFQPGDYLYDSRTQQLWCRGRVDSEPIYNMELGLWYALFEIDSSVRNISMGVYSFLDHVFLNQAMYLGSLDATAKHLSFAMPNPAIKPLEVAVPVKSNKISYGPWYSQPFVNGKTRYERDTNFNPWNYNDCDVMVRAGDIKVATAVTQLQVDEFGSTSIPGPPRLNLGDRAGVIASLQQNGPVVTNISFNVSNSGIKTSYTFKTYSPSWAGMAKQFLDALQRRAEGQQKLASQFRFEMKRALKKFGQYIRPANWGKWGMNPQGVVFDPGSPHTMLMGFIKDSSAGDSLPLVSDAWFVDTASSMFNVGNQSLYPNLAGFSLEGMWRAAGTSDATGGSFPKMEDTQAEFQGSAGLNFKNSNPCPKYFSKAPSPPVRGEDHHAITSKTLNPFIDNPLALREPYELADNGLGHDVSYIIRGAAQPENLSVFIQPTDAMGGWNGTAHTTGDYSGNNYRIMALRGPMVLAGWGFDTYGKPVPSDDGCKFIDNWLRKPDKWKVGPVDLRWDDDRKVWTSPPSFQMMYGVIDGGEDGDCECFILPPSAESSCKVQLSNPAPDDKRVDKDCNDAKDKGCGAIDNNKMIVAYNATNKPITNATQVVVYFDPANLRYYIISAPEPIFSASITKDGVDGKNCGSIPASYETEALQKIGGQETVGDCEITMMNDLDQPLCNGTTCYVWLEDESTCRILQAQFKPLDVVTCVDCYDYNGVPTLEICDRRIYLESAWCEQDCDNDDPTATKDTCGYDGGNFDC